MTSSVEKGIAEFDKAVDKTVGWLGLRTAVNELKIAFAELRAEQQRRYEDTNKLIGEMRERLAALEKQSESVMGAIEDKAGRAASEAVLKGYDTLTKNYNEVLSRLAVMSLQLRTDDGSPIDITPHPAVVSRKRKQLRDGATKTQK